MKSQAGLVSVFGTADVTTVGLLSRVDALVDGEMSLLAEGLVACATYMGSVPSVD